MKSHSYKGGSRFYIRKFLISVLPPPLTHNDPIPMAQKGVMVARFLPWPSETGGGGGIGFSSVQKIVRAPFEPNACGLVE